MNKLTTEQLYEKLKEFDTTKTSRSLDQIIRKLLYDFSYFNIEDIYKDKNGLIDHKGIRRIRKSVINFIYSGKFTLDLNDKLNEKAQVALTKDLDDFKNEIEWYNELGRIKVMIDKESDNIKKVKLINEFHKKCTQNNFDDFFEIIMDSWAKINEHYSKNYIKKIEKIDYVLVYEAPPLSVNGDTSYFLLDDSGRYSTEVKKCFDTSGNIVDVLLSNNLGYFELFMFPLPLNKSNKIDDKQIRKHWSTDIDWSIGGKQLPVVLLEIGLTYLILSKIPIKKELLFAFGTPENTSSSIFEYFSEKKLEVYCKNDPTEFDDVIFREPTSDDNDYELLIESDISDTNSRTTFKDRGKKGTIFPLFKANINDRSGLPHFDLMKNAFGKLTPHNIA